MNDNNNQHGYLHEIEKMPVSIGFMLRYLLAIVGIYLTVLAPVTITMAIRIAILSPHHRDSNLGFILGVGAFVAIFANPFFGQLSDLTRSRLGRRKPWALGGMIVATLGLLGVGEATSIAWVAIFWWITQLAMNASFAAMVAVIADRIPPQQQGRISAMLGMSVFIAMLVAAAVVNMVGTGGIGMFIVPALIGLGFMILFLVFYREIPVISTQTRTFSLLRVLDSFKFNPRKYPDFSWAWLSRFLIQYAASVVITYQVYYLMDVMKYSASDVKHPVFIAMLLMSVIVIVVSLVFGWLSDRYYKRKIFILISGVIYVFGVGILAITTSFHGYFLAIFIFAIGLGIYLAIEYALILDVLPREEDTAKNLGIFNIAIVGPQSLAPATAPLLLGIGSHGSGNYPLLFGASACIALLGGLIVLPIKGSR